MKVVLTVLLLNIFSVQIATGAALRPVKRVKVEKSEIISTPFDSLEWSDGEEPLVGAINLTLAWGSQTAAIEISKNNNHSTIRKNAARAFGQPADFFGNNIFFAHPKKGGGWGFLAGQSELSQPDFKLLEELATSTKSLSVLITMSSLKSDFGSSQGWRV